MPDQVEPDLREGTADAWARARAVFEVALDCIISMDGDGRVVDFNPAAERTFGYRREETIGRPLADLIIPPALRERHRQGIARYRATGEARVLGRRVELTAIRRDGTEFAVELAITSVGTEAAPLFIAYLRDISDRVHSEQLRNIRLAVTQHLAQAHDVTEAARAVVSSICEHLRWDFGAFWSVGPGDEALHCVATHNARGTAIEPFDVATRARRLRRDEGLPGRVWLTGRADWVLDVVRDQKFPRARLAEEGGLRSAFACPILVGGRVLGVMEFFTAHLREPDAELLETIATVAAQVGQYIERRDAEERLRDSEVRFRALMDQAPISMQIFAPDGRTLRVNPAWTELWGVTLDEIPDYNVLADPQLAATGVLPYLQRAFAGEAVAIPAIAYDPNVTIPDRTRHADPVRYVSAVAYPIKDDAGHVREVVLVHEDITPRARAETALRESEEKLRLLADTIPQLAWMAQPDGYIFWYNRRWYEYTGTTPQDMEGWGWQSVHDPAALPQVLERWKASIATGEPFDMVFPLKGADGTFRPFLTRVNPLRDTTGGIVYWFGTNTDISDIKRMEDALRESDRRKDEFLATLSHELRNPLAPIVSALELLRRPGAAADRARDVIDRHVKHLVRLVDDLLDLSRVAHGRIELRREPVDVSPVIARGVEIVRPLIEARGHVLEVSIAPESFAFDADPVRLAQVIGNLLNNAAKYTPHNGRIIVQAYRDGDEGVVSVADNGIGIAHDVLPVVFDSFVRGTHTSEDGGLGIGLALVKSLVELHGGRVEAHSEGPGTGARFTVRIPVASPAQADSIARSASAPASARRILVVDDNRDAAEMLAELLRHQGHDVHVAFDGASAVVAAAAHLPQIVFLDLGMPGVDGYEAARRIRATPGMEVARLVALTGWGQAEDRRRTAAAGFDHHLVKPPDIAALQQVLRDQ